MILQHILKGENRNEIDNINFEKEKFVEEFNQTVPEELSNRWKDDIQRSLKILKGNLAKKADTSKSDKYICFDMDNMIYLSDNKRLFFNRNLNDYY
jgi:hypothetical protein